MRIDVLSIFPEYLQPLNLSLIGKAVTDGVLHLAVTDPRDFTTDRHRTVDDTPYGGGAGMVMKPEPWTLALESLVRAGGDAAASSSPAPPEPHALSPTAPTVAIPAAPTARRRVNSAGEGVVSRAAGSPGRGEVVMAVRSFRSRAPNPRTGHDPAWGAGAGCFLSTMGSGADGWIPVRGTGRKAP